MSAEEAPRKFKTTLSVDLSSREFVAVSADLIDERGHHHSLDKRRLPFLVLQLNELMELVHDVGDESLKQGCTRLEYNRVLVIFTPENVSYYQFSDERVLKEYERYLLAVCTFGRDQVPLKQWLGAESDARRWQSDVERLSAMAHLYKQEKHKANTATPKTATANATAMASIPLHNSDAVEE